MSFGIWELVIILLIVALLFGTKKLRTLGGDLGSAIKSFRSAVSETEKESITDKTEKAAGTEGEVIDAEVEPKK